jgi:hypothetical protein
MSYLSLVPMQTQRLNFKCRKPAVPIEAVCPHHGHAPLQLLAGAEARRDRALLVFRTEVVIVERAVTVGQIAGAGGCFQHRWQPDGGKSDLAQFVCLAGQMVPPPGKGRIAVCRRRKRIVRGSLKNPCNKTPIRFERTRAYWPTPFSYPTGGAINSGPTGS